MTRKCLFGQPFFNLVFDDMNSSELILSKKFCITTAEVDIQQNLRTGALVNVLIQSAIESADKLGFGFDNISSHNLLWVLNKLSLKIYSKVFWKDELTVYTWPKCVDGLQYIRDFEVMNQKGEKVAAATSSWLAIDNTTRRPKIINDETTEVFSRLKDKHAIQQKPEKLLPSCEGEEKVITPEYTDFDLNGHVTATRYIDFMTNCFELLYLSNNRIDSLDINYLKEILPNEKLLILKSSDNAKEYIFEGLNSEIKKSFFRGKIRFKK